MSHQPAVLPSTMWPSKVKPHTITFVRHAEKNGPGFTADLTRKGFDDAVEAGKRIGCRVDLFIASPSPRAVSTAMAIKGGNGSSAQVIENYQLADPGMGRYVDLPEAMKSFFNEMRDLVEKNNADVVIATTHDFVIRYVAQICGGYTVDTSEFLCGITLNLEQMFQMSESL